MSDINCPYCGAENEINHDDGYGYEEDRKHEQDCVSCEREFKFTTSIMFHYEVFCQDGDHDMEQPSDDHPDFYHCKKCEFSEIRR